MSTTSPTSSSPALRSNSSSPLSSPSSTSPRKGRGTKSKQRQWFHDHPPPQPPPPMSGPGLIPISRSVPLLTALTTAHPPTSPTSSTTSSPIIGPQLHSPFPKSAGHHSTSTPSVQAASSPTQLKNSPTKVGTPKRNEREMKQGMKIKPTTMTKCPTTNLTQYNSHSQEEKKVQKVNSRRSLGDPTATRTLPKNQTANLRVAPKRQRQSLQIRAPTKKVTTASSEGELSLQPPNLSNSQETQQQPQHQPYGSKQRSLTTPSALVPRSNSPSSPSSPSSTPPRSPSPSPSSPNINPLSSSFSSLPPGLLISPRSKAEALGQTGVLSSTSTTPRSSPPSSPLPVHDHPPPNLAASPPALQRGSRKGSATTPSSSTPTTPSSSTTPSSETLSRRSGSLSLPRATLLVGSHPFLDVLRISGLKKTLVIEQTGICEKLLKQMHAVVCRPLGKGAAGKLISRECSQFGLASNDPDSLVFFENDEELQKYVLQGSTLLFAEKPFIPQNFVRDSRFKIVNEILETERSYISCLLEMSQYRVGLSRAVKKLEEGGSKRKSRRLASKDELSGVNVDSLFGNLEKMIKLNGEFYSTLKTKLHNWSDEQTIGDCFTSLVSSDKRGAKDAKKEKKKKKMQDALVDWGGGDVQSLFEQKSNFGADYVYAEWGKNYNHALRTYEKIKSISVLYDALMNLKRSLDLDAMLIMPVQRLPRYSLLIDDLVKHTDPNHVDYAPLIDAGKDIQKLTVHVDNQIKFMQNASNDLVKEIPWLKKYVSVDRTFHCHLKTVAKRRNLGNYFLQQKFPSTEEKVILCLFDDLLVYHFDEDQSSSPIEVPLNLVWCNAMNKEDKFEIVIPLTAITVCCPEGPMVKLQWVPLLKRTIRNFIPDSSLNPPGEMGPPDEREGTSELTGGASYSGLWNWGVMSGSGTLKLEGLTFVGEWKSGQRHGKGKSIFPDGIVQEGYWKEDAIDGEGKIENSNGDVYNGYIVEEEKKCVCFFFESSAGNAKHGHGRMQYANGDVYEGEWETDLPSGAGNFSMTRGETTIKYFGNFKRGIFHGDGILAIGDSEYVGPFHEGLKQGKGKLRRDGMRYDGDFSSDLFHGNGILTYADGTRYLGEFDNGSRHGEGTLYLSSGATYMGQWKKGRQSGKGTMTYPDGSTYIGAFKEGKMHGPGVWKKGEWSFEGQWKHGLRDGPFAVRKGQPANESKKSKIIPLDPLSHTESDTLTYKEGVLTQYPRSEFILGIHQPTWFPPFGIYL